MKNLIYQWVANFLFCFPSFSQISNNLNFEQWETRTKIVPYEPIEKNAQIYQLTSTSHAGNYALEVKGQFKYGTFSNNIERLHDTVKNQLQYKPTRFTFWAKQIDSADFETHVSIRLYKNGSEIGFTYNSSRLLPGGGFKEYTWKILYMTPDTPDNFIIEISTNKKGRFEAYNTSIIDDIYAEFADGSKKLITDFESNSTKTYDMAKYFNSSDEWNIYQTVIQNSNYSSSGSNSIKVSKFGPQITSLFPTEIFSDLIPLSQVPDTFFISMAYDSFINAGESDYCYIGYQTHDKNKNIIVVDYIEIETDSLYSNQPFKEYNLPIYKTLVQPKYIQIFFTGGDPYIESPTVFYFDNIKFSYNSNLTTSELYKSQSRMAFPNPAHDIIQVPLSSNESGTYIIYNMEGKKVSEGIIAANASEVETLKVPLQNFQDGQYLLQTIQGKISSSHRFIIQK